MRLNDDGEFVLSQEEIFVLRQGLFITNYHLDPAFDQDLHTLTGVQPDEFKQLMSQIDHLRSSL